MIKITKTKEGARLEYDFEIKLNIHEFLIVSIMVVVVMGAMQ